MFKEFGLRGTPTTMLVQPDGTEIDRLTDYNGNPDEFKAELEEAIRSDKSFLKLSRAYQEDSENLETIIWLSRKYEIRRDLGSGLEMAEKILARADEAKEIMVPFGPEKTEISGYEWAQFTQTYKAPEFAGSFCEEFPQSVMNPQVFRNLSRFLNSPELGDKAFEVYDRLFEKYPGNADLGARYIAFAASTGEKVDKALEIAPAIYKISVESIDRWVAANYAKLYLHKDDTVKAVEVFGEEFVTLFTEAGDADNLNGFAWFWAVEGKNLESALKAANKSIELKDDANTWDTVSMVYWKMGDYQKAIEAEEKALEMVGGKSQEFEARIARIKEDMESAG